MTGASATSWAVEIVNLSKSYRPGGWGTAVHALRSITLRIGHGQVLGLLGPNGSGKSTTLRVLAGLLRPSRGECRILGHEAGSDEARMRIGYVPEMPHFPAHLSGRAFLDYCAGLCSLSRRQARRRIDELVKWTRIGDAVERRLGHYSKGMLQRIGLAQALLHEPPVLLLDEPSGGLDPAARLEFSGLIRELAGRGTTVVMSSHLLPQAAALCDRIAILGNGQLIADGTPFELLGRLPSREAQASDLERLYIDRTDCRR